MIDSVKLISNLTIYGITWPPKHSKKPIVNWSLWWVFPIYSGHLSEHQGRFHWSRLRITILDCGWGMHFVTVSVQISHSNGIVGPRQQFTCSRCTNQEYRKKLGILQTTSELPWSCGRWWWDASWAWQGHQWGNKCCFSCTHVIWLQIAQFCSSNGGELYWRRIQGWPLFRSIRTIWLIGFVAFPSSKRVSWSNTRPHRGDAYPSWPAG